MLYISFINSGDFNIFGDSLCIKNLCIQIHFHIIEVILKNRTRRCSDNACRSYVGCLSVKSAEIKMIILNENNCTMSGRRPCLHTAACAWSSISTSKQPTHYRSFSHLSLSKRKILCMMSHPLHDSIFHRVTCFVYIQALKTLCCALIVSLTDLGQVNSLYLLCTIYKHCISSVFITIMKLYHANRHRSLSWD